MSRTGMRWIGLAFATAGVLAANANSYTWTGASVIDVGWERNANWNPTVIPGTYPSTIGDDAFIPYTSGGYDVWLVNVTIDDVTITGDVDFSTASGTKTVNCDTFTISGSTNGATVTVASGAVIATY